MEIKCQTVILQSRFIPIIRPLLRELYSGENVGNLSGNQFLVTILFMFELLENSNKFLNNKISNILHHTLKETTSYLL